MEITRAFLINTLNTVKSNIAVTDGDFNIVFTNKSWDKFGKQNGCPDSFDWLGVNYFSPCLSSALDGDEFSVEAVKQFDQLKNGVISEFQLEYPCHSLTEDRWFHMEVTKLSVGQDTYYVISHQNITARVKLEQKALELSRLDGLTSICNRRAFDDFLNMEWHHCLRNNFSVSFAMIDIDDFKQINDEFGHQAGDECLKNIAEILTSFANRASDKCARYGGDEFVIAWGQCQHDNALAMMKDIITQINQINIITAKKSIQSRVSTSIGLCTTTPRSIALKDFISVADQLMYAAKDSGKNAIKHKKIKDGNVKNIVFKG